VEYGILLWERVELDDAFKVLRKATEIAPWSGFAEGAFSEFLIETDRGGRFLNLDAVAQRAIELPYSRLAFHLGLILRRDEAKLEQASQLLRLAVNALPDDVSARRALAESLMLREEWAPAATEFKLVLERAPNESEVWRGLGTAQQY